MTFKEISPMLTHLSDAFPNEGCGFLLGRTVSGERMVTEVRPVRNAQEGDQRRRFLIDPVDYIRAENYALEQDLELLGIYHSHPQHPAIPSEHDLKQAVPGFSYVIASVMDGKPVKVTSWRLNEVGSAFEEEFIANSSEELTTSG